MPKIKLNAYAIINRAVEEGVAWGVNDHESAEAVAAWAGTRDMFDVTAQIGAEGATGMGSVRRNKEFIIHPDAIKQDLQPGEAFYISKVGKFCSEKIKVNYS